MRIGDKSMLDRPVDTAYSANGGLLQANSHLWKPSYSYLLLGLATLACLLPFSGKAFHMDDPLFVWTAHQIALHPLNPYGFHVLWSVVDEPMSAITKNPPLSAYYGALIGITAGWSEEAWHLGFTVPALAVVLGTYRLAERFTQSPMVSAAATLCAPGFLVSATSVMCDVVMLALWVWAIVFWLKGTDSGKALPFAVSGTLITACAFTKYFGASLILLLFAHALIQWRRVGVRISCLIIPIAGLIWYQFWSKSLYGKGLLWDAAGYAHSAQHTDRLSLLTSGLITLSFVGGCALPVLLFAPFLWRRRHLLLVLVAGALFVLTVGMHAVRHQVHQPDAHPAWIGVQLAIFIAGGILVLGLALADYRNRRTADSMLLLLWVAGTFIFAGFVNWTINARSVLPLIPASAILLARRLDESRVNTGWSSKLRMAVPLSLSLVASLSIALGDTAFANSERTMASMIHVRMQAQAGSVLFQGHWGFQYYMQQLGAHPAERNKPAFQTGDVMVTPENANNTFPIAAPFVSSEETLVIDPHAYVATMARGAGFYSSVWGPLPFSFGRAPAERYRVVHLKQLIKD